MRATVMYGAGDVRVENVPDPTLTEPTDAVVRVLRSCICGSDLWPYRSMPATTEGRRMGHEFLGVVEDVGADVSGVKTGDVVVAPFVWAATPATSANRVCSLVTGTAGSGVPPACTAVRARPCGCRRRRARS